MDSLQDPIAFILDEHERQLEVCDHLEDLMMNPDSEATKSVASAVFVFLTEDLPRHIEDEECDLFPALASRKDSHGDLPVILDQLVSEHELDRGLVEPIVEELRGIVDGQIPAGSKRFCVNARAFTEAMRRHLNWENRIVLPLAEKVLTEQDRREMGRKMADRRRSAVSGSK